MVQELVLLQTFCEQMGLLYLRCVRKLSSYLGKVKGFFLVLSILLQLKRLKGPLTGLLIRN